MVVAVLKIELWEDYWRIQQQLLGFLLNHKVIDSKTTLIRHLNRWETTWGLHHSDTHITGLWFWWLVMILLGLCQRHFTADWCGVFPDFLLWIVWLGLVEQVGASDLHARHMESLLWLAFVVLRGYSLFLLGLLDLSYSLTGLKWFLSRLSGKFRGSILSDFGFEIIDQ
jgi:hypothetical protein